jgi:hypothetical protein
MKIKVSDYIYKKCVKFAEDRMGGSADLYTYRGEKNKAKMFDDILIGTLGEWAAYKFLKDLDIKVSKPDMKIYEKRRKSFDADLTNDKFKFHVKSQSVVSRKRYGSSWLLQRSDKVVSDPQDGEYFILTCVEGKEVEILACIFIRDIVNNQLWGECKVPRYRHSKVALYLDDLNDNIQTRRFFNESKNGKA